jgi:hypothetical protein
MRLTRHVPSATQECAGYTQVNCVRLNPIRVPRSTAAYRRRKALAARALELHPEVHGSGLFQPWISNSSALGGDAGTPRPSLPGLHGRGLRWTPSPQHFASSGARPGWSGSAEFLGKGRRTRSGWLVGGHRRAQPGSRDWQPQKAAKQIDDRLVGSRTRRRRRGRCPGPLGGGQPDGAAVPAVPDRQVTAAADLADDPPISVLHPVVR